MEDFGPAEADIAKQFAAGRDDRVSPSFSVLVREGQPWAFHWVAKACQFVLERQIAEGSVERETVADRFGNVVDVLINKKSRYESLNRVIKQIVYAGAPYNAFSEEMRKEGDILQIVRTWTFTNNSLKTKSVGK